MAKRPLYAAAFLINLGIVAFLVSAAYSILDRVLLRPLPYRDPKRLISVWMAVQNPDTGVERRSLLSAPQFYAWKQQAGLFDESAAFYAWRQPLISAEVSREELVAEVSHEFLATLGVAPFMGRDLLPEEDLASATRAVILSYRFWKSAYHGDSAVLGRALEIDRRPALVVGVLPQDFRFYFRLRPDLGSPAEEAAVFASMGRRLSQLRQYPNWYQLRIIARLAEGAPTDLGEELKRITESSAQNKSLNGDYKIRWQTLLDEAVADIRPTLLILQAAACAIFALGCINLANLAFFRRTQLLESSAIRHALGAGRLQANLPLLAELAFLIAAAVVLGLGSAYAMLVKFSDLMASSFVRLHDPPGASSFLAAGLAVASFAALICFFSAAAAPAAALGRSVFAKMRSGGSRTLRKAHSSTVVFQIAMATALLAISLLLLHSYRELSAIDPGFERKGRTAVRLNMPYSVYKEEAPRRLFASSLEERLLRHPAIRRVGFTDGMPFLSFARTTFFEIPGREQQDRPQAIVRTVSDGYFEALGVDLLEGRLFTAMDDASSRPVCIISRAAADRFDWGPQALGREAELDQERRTVIGVVEDTKWTRLAGDDEPVIYLPAPQATAITDSLVIETNLETATLTPLVTSQVRGLDARVVVAKVAPLGDLVSSVVQEPRFRSVALTTFALISLGLVGVGLSAFSRRP